MAGKMPTPQDFQLSCGVGILPAPQDFQLSCGVGILPAPLINNYFHFIYLHLLSDFSRPMYFSVITVS
jgi:hypothetical protein